MKRAVDTNILIRLLVRDDRSQTEKVLALTAIDTLVVPTTVLLETEWVLRGVYTYDRQSVSQCFDQLLAFDVIEFVDESLVLEAIGLFKLGMDFADALHLIGSSDVKTFATFDRDLAKRARRAGSGLDILLL